MICWSIRGTSAQICSQMSSLQVKIVNRNLMSRSWCFSQLQNCVSRCLMWARRKVCVCPQKWTVFLPMMSFIGCRVNDVVSSTSGEWNLRFVSDWRGTVRTVATLKARSSIFAEEGAQSKCYVTVRFAFVLWSVYVSYGWNRHVSVQRRRIPFVHSPFDPIRPVHQVL